MHRIFASIMGSFKARQACKIRVCNSAGNIATAMLVTRSVAFVLITVLGEVETCLTFFLPAGPARVEKQTRPNTSNFTLYTRLGLQITLHEHTKTDL